jgi:hypothetical protein
MEVVAAVAELPVAMAVAEDEPPVEIATAVAAAPFAASSLVTGWSGAVGLCLSAT